MTPILQHQLVLDRRKAVLATRLCMHADSSAAAAQELNRLMPRWTFAQPVLVALPDCVVDEGLLAWRMPAHLLLEIPADDLENPAFKAIRSECNARKVAYCARGMSAQTHPPLKYVLTDFSAFPKATLAERQLATGLADMSAFDDALAAGYSGASGDFFLHPLRMPGTQINAGHAHIIHLLNLVRNNAEVKDIEVAFKKDVSLAFKFLRYINSAGFGLMTQIGSFRQAVTVIGYSKLNRWLSLLMVNAGRDAVAPALMRTALLRAYMMERLGVPKLGQNHADNLFITGAFSVLETLLGTRIDVLLQHLKLPDEISGALLGVGGDLLPFLQLGLAAEGEDKDALRVLLDDQRISAEDYNDALIEALEFAGKLQFE